MSGKYLNLASDTVSKLDSLDAVSNKKIQINTTKQDSIRAAAVADSLRIDQERKDAIPTLGEKVETIPAVKALNFVADIPGLREAAVYFNQMLYDVGAHTYNLGAVPINTLGRIFGYNPGFSGERVMGNILGDWSGVDPKKTLSSSYHEVAKIFHPSAEYESTAWGTYAPPGGEWSYETAEKKKKKKKEEQKKVSILYRNKKGI